MQDSHFMVVREMKLVSLCLSVCFEFTSKGLKKYFSVRTSRQWETHGIRTWPLANRAIPVCELDWEGSKKKFLDNTTSYYHRLWLSRSQYPPSLTPHSAKYHRHTLDCPQINRPLQVPTVKSRNSVWDQRHSGTLVMRRLTGAWLLTGLGKSQIIAISSCEGPRLIYESLHFHAFEQLTQKPSQVMCWQRK